MTCVKREVPGNREIENHGFPYPFKHLDIIKTKGSSGKCWVFHRDEDGRVLGFLFPGGYRIKGIPYITSNTGEFFMENRNFLDSRYGLLGVKLPDNSTEGTMYKCELILIVKLFLDENREICVRYQKFLNKRTGHRKLESLMKHENMETYISKPVSALIKSIKITYINSFHQLTRYEEGYQMSKKGPDNYVMDYHNVENHIKLIWKLKNSHSFLPIQRKQSKEFLPRRLKNSLLRTKVYIITASNKANPSLGLLKKKAIFDSIPYRNIIGNIRTHNTQAIYMFEKKN